MSEVLNVIQTLSETNDFILPTAILLLDYYNKGNKLARGGVWGTIIWRMILIYDVLITIWTIALDRLWTYTWGEGEGGLQPEAYSIF